MDDIREAAQALIDDHEHLVTENSYLKSVVAAQQLQLKRYEGLLCLTQGEALSESENLTVASNGNWIKTFLYNSAVVSPSPRIAFSFLYD